MGVRGLIEEARRLDAAATPGPWFVVEALDGEILPDRSGNVDGYCETGEINAAPEDAGDPLPVAEHVDRRGNRAFIVGVRALLPALVNELEAALARERSVQATNETLATELTATEKSFDRAHEKLTETRACLAPLDALSEGEREAMVMWLQAAMQQGPAMVRRGAAALLEIVRADIL